MYSNTVRCANDVWSVNVLCTRCADRSVPYWHECHVFLKCPHTRIVTRRWLSWLRIMFASASDANSMVYKRKLTCNWPFCWWRWSCRDLNCNLVNRCRREFLLTVLSTSLTCCNSKWSSRPKYMIASDVWPHCVRGKHVCITKYWFNNQNENQILTNRATISHNANTSIWVSDYLISRKANLRSLLLSPRPQQTSNCQYQKWFRIMNSIFVIRMFNSIHDENTIASEPDRASWPSPQFLAPVTLPHWSSPLSHVCLCAI